MKRKEIKNLAEKIAKCEIIAQTSKDEKAIERAQNEIIKLTKCVSNWDELVEVEEIVINLLEKNLKKS